MGWSRVGGGGFEIKRTYRRFNVVYCFCFLMAWKLTLVQILYWYAALRPAGGRLLADRWPTECSYTTVKGLLQLGKPHYQQADFRMVQLLQVGTQGG